MEQPAPPHRPEDAGPAASLSSSAMPEFAPVPVRPRHDGWTPARQRIFLEALIEYGDVKTAAMMTGISRTSAYRLKRRPDAIAFSRAWDAAILIARDAHQDELHQRALHGWQEEVHYHGEPVSYRRRFSPWLLIEALKRLDRKAEGFDAEGHVARTAASHIDELIECVGEGGDPTRLLAEQDAAAERALYRISRERVSDEELIARMEMRRRVQAIEAMEPEDIDTGDLDPADLESGACEEWSDEQWARADCSGWLERHGWTGEEDEDEDEEDFEEEEEDDLEGEACDAGGDPGGDPAARIFSLKGV